MTITEANRQAGEISMFNPLREGDGIELESRKWQLWQVGCNSYGWKLHKPGKPREIHPTIHDIRGMDDFIGAILDASK